MNKQATAEYKIFEYDPGLLPYKTDIEQRMKNYYRKKTELVGQDGSLCDFANGHEYFGFHRTDGGWVYREWAPGADGMYLTGDMVHWDRFRLPLTPLENGVWEVYLEGEDALYDGCHVKAIVLKEGRLLERIPLYIRRVLQDKDTYAWCGVIVDEPAYEWKNGEFTPSKHPFIYECHIGMAQEKEGIGSYREFIDNTLPRIKALGYDTIQIMAIMEHPYYGSFGYQVSNFFAPCSRYGTPNGLKELIDTAHGMGIGVLLDVVHSHAVKNTAEGLNEFDGTTYQFFHEGGRGDHPAWGTKLFNYNKNEVIHFLLSNLKYWLTEFHFDGFRFDGVTSMLYHDHGLGTAFTDYSKYFSLNTDTEAVTYLQLATELIKEVNPHALNIAEDMSAMPGMCLPIKEGGIGFDYRLSMGDPDMWIKILKTQSDEQWNMWQLWSELTSRRPGEKYIGYVESHDQALVGDKTVMFRLCDSKMYTDMTVLSDDKTVERGVALHKLIRMLTMSLGGEGYLNFMGNEFGHPEWIDFPREGNGWSYFYCRRQWHLADDPLLKYRFLNNFDEALVSVTKKHHIFKKAPNCLFIDANAQVLMYERNGLVFAINFSPNNAYEGYYMAVPEEGRYKVVFSSDEQEFGGWDRISKNYVYTAGKQPDGSVKLRIYLPARTGLCMVKVK
ncbi:MAG: alpha amylase C-terminal domain-containing protein [Clostridia bacterium]|nr:alpha amylase C-terminal domain-containing protein [Clostridia bacterium]